MRSMQIVDWGRPLEARDCGESEFPAKQPTLIVGKNSYEKCR
jgi:hypothetical protein